MTDVEGEGPFDSTLHEIVSHESRCKDKLQSTLEANPHLINETDENGLTAFHVLCQQQWVTTFPATDSRSF